MKMITVFTPIYNRAYIIDQLYQSLLRQTNSEFEWLIVDDGSTDNIVELAERWMKGNQKFQIRFYRQENGGKHRAINYGVKLAKHEAFFIVDSDDYLEDDAIETILKYWNDINTDGKFAGISGLRRHKNGEIIGGKPAFNDYVDATNLERGQFGLGGDKAEIYKTELIRRFPFPEYENELFITEAVVWNRIAYEGYGIRWINKSFIICDYRQDGLTAKGQQLFLDNPKGWACYIRMQIECGVIEKNSYLKKCYYYYECECQKLFAGEIKRLLGLNDLEFYTITEQYTNFLQKLTELCSGKTVCIYAYGQWGKRLKRYLDCLGIRVNYVIDKQFDKIKEMKAYSIEMDLSQVDVILVALSKGAEEAAKIVKNKMHEAKVILCQDIKPEIW